jgi:predicted dehydrogenase (TIGR03970 family)
MTHSDVLIVGAGSAGSVLAERLSANPDCRVTVLEAGPGPGDSATVAMVRDGRTLPIGAASPLVRRYPTLLTDDPPRSANLVRGATMGGSGAVNGGYFCHARPSDFDDPAIPGWSPAEVEKHYRATETDLDFPDDGPSGPIHIRRVAEFGDIAAAFVAAARSAGFRWIPNLNAEHPGTGIGAVPLNIIDGVRDGPGTAFLQPALARSNLTMLTSTRAVGLRFAGKRVIGCDALGPDGTIVLRADRTVLAAGAIESAKLLMLAGIGPALTLAAAGIDTMVDLPVGARFWDHPEWVMPTDWQVAIRRPVLEALLVQESIEVRPYSGGFIAMTGQTGAGAPDWPHIGVALMQPASRGRLTLVSADPMVPPMIEHRYDCEPSDTLRLREGIELVREIISGAAKLGMARWSTSQHLSGTAPMGLDADENAVVDQQCAVRGVTGLWVIDGAVLPWVTSVGPHATIVMLAHRAAQFVS